VRWAQLRWERRASVARSLLRVEFYLMVPIGESRVAIRPRPSDEPAMKMRAMAILLCSPHSISDSGTGTLKPFSVTETRQYSPTR